MYRFKNPEKINDLLDGRTIKYLAKEIDLPREYLSLILRGKMLCHYLRADKIVKRCNSRFSVKDFFEKIDGGDIQ